MKVYITTAEVDYEGGVITGVWSTQEKAEKHLAKEKAKGIFFDRYEITEVTIDDPDTRKYV